MTGAWCCSAICQWEANQPPAGGASECLAAVLRRLVGHVEVGAPAGSELCFLSKPLKLEQPKRPAVVSLTRRRSV